MHLKKYIAKNNLLLLILLVAAILRFWNFFEIPLTHDEVSALNRTQFDNFSDLIEYGVKADTHPPGVQVFTYYWVKTFGYEQWVVKLPFLLMGLGSLVIAYGLFKKWSNQSVALLIISFLATLQLTVMYSQIARPYISGMFLVLCMVYFWDGLVNRPERHFWRNLILTALFGAACGYNHHFSLLAAFIIGLTGIFVITPKYIPKYLLMGILLGLLYLPNLPIFLHQLERGGVGEWLAPPTPQFIIDFYSYTFNHSLPLIFTFVLVIATGIYNGKNKAAIKWVIISGIWFFSVWIIGYYYSVYRNPVLQFSMLLFFFPFMFHTFLGWIPELRKRTQTVLVFTILFVGVTSLTFHRKHFEVFYANRYFQMKKDAAQYDPDKTCFVFATYPHFLKIDFPRNINFPDYYLAWEDNVNTIAAFEEYIVNCNKEQLFLGHVEQFPKELIALAQHYYPNLKEVNYTSGAASYLFSKGWEYQDLSYMKWDILDNPTINFNAEKLTSDGGYMDQGEWSIGKELDVSYAIQHKYDMLAIHSKLKIKNPDQEIMLVGEFPDTSQQEPYYWVGKSSKEYFYNKKDQTVDIFITFSLDNILKNTPNLPPLKTYIWNISKDSITIIDYDVELLVGNRNKYCLWEDF